MARPSRSSATCPASGRSSSRSSRRCRRSSTRRARSAPDRARPRHQQHVHQQRHHELINEELDGSLRLTIPIDVPHPAAGLRGDRRAGDSAAPGGDVARRRVRLPRPVQPDRRRRQPERDPAGRPDGPCGRGRLLAVHDHPLQDGAAAGRHASRMPSSRPAARPVGRCSSAESPSSSRSVVSSPSGSACSPGWPSGRWRSSSCR